MLCRADAIKGLNFYRDYGVFEAVQDRFPKYKTQLYANMLRSEHIPFNIFIPFRIEKNLFCETIKLAIGIDPAKVLSISIEHAPDRAAKRLGDKTSFDVFCDCEDRSGNRFFIGIEVKYTERQYKIGKKENEYCQDLGSSYYEISKRSGLYLPSAFESLKTDRFRQMWRNHLLAEATLETYRTTYKYYRSVILFPSGNKHLSKVADEYKGLLSKGSVDTFKMIKFEDFFSAIQMQTSSPRAKKWAAYLSKRYIPPSEAT